MCVREHVQACTRTWCVLYGKILSNQELARREAESLAITQVWELGDLDSVACGLLVSAARAPVSISDLHGQLGGRVPSSLLQIRKLGLRGVEATAKVIQLARAGTGIQVDGHQSLGV